MKKNIVANANAATNKEEFSMKKSINNVPAKFSMFLVKRFAGIESKGDTLVFDGKEAFKPFEDYWKVYSNPLTYGETEWDKIFEFEVEYPMSFKKLGLEDLVAHLIGDNRSDHVEVNYVGGLVEIVNYWSLSCDEADYGFWAGDHNDRWLVDPTTFKVVKSMSTFCESFEEEEAITEYLEYAHNEDRAYFESLEKTLG